MTPAQKRADGVREQEDPEQRRKESWASAPVIYYSTNNSPFITRQPTAHLLLEKQQPFHYIPSNLAISGATTVQFRIQMAVFVERAPVQNSFKTSREREGGEGILLLGHPATTLAPR